MLPVCAVAERSATSKKLQKDLQLRTVSIFMLCFIALLIYMPDRLVVNITYIKSCQRLS